MAEKGRSSFRHRRRSTGTSSSPAAPTAKGRRGRAVSTATSGVGMRGRARCSGRFTPCRGRGSQAARRGRKARTRIAPAPMPGGSSPSTSSAGSCSCRSAARPPISTAPIVTGTTSTATRSSRWMRATGKLKWYQQLVHHDLWDYDPAAPPTLIEMRRGGQVIPGVAQTTKMGMLFMFNRVTGEPLFGMEELPVPQTVVPGRVHGENAAVHDQAAAAGAVEVRSREGLLHADARARRLLQGRLGEARDVRRRPVRADAAERQRRDVPQHARRRRLRRRVVQPAARPGLRQRVEPRHGRAHGAQEGSGHRRNDVREELAARRRVRPVLESRTTASRVRPLRSESSSRSTSIPATSPGGSRSASSRSWKRKGSGTPGR